MPLKPRKSLHVILLRNTSKRRGNRHDALSSLGQSGAGRRGEATVFGRAALRSTRNVGTIVEATSGLAVSPFPFSEGSRGRTGFTSREGRLVSFSRPKGHGAEQES